MAVKHIGGVKGSNWWAGILCPMWLGDIYSDRYSRCGKDDLYSSTLEMGTKDRAFNWCAVDRGKDWVGSFDRQ